MSERFMSPEFLLCQEFRENRRQIDIVSYYFYLCTTDNKDTFTMELLCQKWSVYRLKKRDWSKEVIRPQGHCRTRTSVQD